MIPPLSVALLGVKKNFAKVAVTGRESKSFMVGASLSMDISKIQQTFGFCES